MTTPRLNPALPPPPGQTSHFADPISIIRWDILCTAVCLSITTIVFVLRAWVRIVISKQWILEDYMCCISYIGFIVYCTLMTVTFDRHGGVHAWDLTLPESYEAIYWFNATSIEYGPVILSTKMTLLLLYRRVFLPHRWSVFDITLRVFMVLCCVYYLTSISLKIWECTPRAKIWNKSIEGTCLNIAKVLNADGVFNTLSDFSILLVPVKALWTLQMKMGRKVGIGLVFTVGLIAPIFSIVGWVMRRRNSSSLDATYNDPKILLWAAAEIYAGLICTCLPTTPVLLDRCRTSRRTKNTLGMDPHSRHLRTLARNQPPASSDQHPLNREYLELSEGLNSLDGSVEAREAVVATDIEGGIPRRNQINGPVDLKAIEDGLIQKPAIMKTVVVEQSNDARR